ncbi:EcsC family protein [Methyloprofundus sp.]|uniref:EcsC family protein n=1 Tax=Methyloprofundus sp. TaxID=2020875 RepID=UPI003D1265F7
MKLTTKDLTVLHQAADVLENPSFSSKLTKTVGGAVEKTIAILPAQVALSLNDITRTALEKSLEGAIFTLNSRKSSIPYNRTHKFFACLSGAVGGAFGFTAITVELPISTTIMLRSIADIARFYGENLSHSNTKMACLEVFALSDTTKHGSETGYYAIRSILAKGLADASTQLSTPVISKESAPIVSKAINQIAARFSVPVSEKLAAQSVPVIGAIGGATINLLFISYFQNLAHAHFALRRLERNYTPEIVKLNYQKYLAQQQY